jgi:hypothetical protein
MRKKTCGAPPAKFEHFLKSQFSASVRKLRPPRKRQKCNEISMPKAHNSKPPAVDVADLPETIGIELAAQIAKCTPRHIQQLVKTGFIPRPERGRYTILGVVHGRIASLQDEQRTSTKSASASRVQDARAAEIEQRTAKEAGVLLQQGQAEALNVVDEFFGPLRSDLLAVLARVTADIALRRRIEDGIEDAFGSAAKRALAAADRVEASSETLRAAAKGDARRMGAKQPRVSSKPRKARAA